MDGSRDYHAKWSKPDRERQRWHVILYMWNLKGKKTHKWTYFQNRNWLTDTENKLMFTKRHRGGWGKARIKIHKLLCVKQMPSADLLHSTGNETQYYATTCKEKKLRVRGGQVERGHRGWGGRMASLTQRTGVWANSRESEGQRSLARLGSQRVR